MTLPRGITWGNILTIVAAIVGVTAFVYNDRIERAQDLQMLRAELTTKIETLRTEVNAKLASDDKRIALLTMQREGDIKRLEEHMDRIRADLAKVLEQIERLRVENPR